MEKDKSFLGTGWSFPPEFDKPLEEVVMKSNEEDIRESLAVILSTQLGERIMVPKFGCNLRDILFESLNLTTKTYAENLIRDAVLYFEPRINILSITIDESSEFDGVLLIKIDFIVRATNTRTNMVYPYYRQEGTDVR